jgi:hypothetical protein
MLLTCELKYRVLLNTKKRFCQCYLTKAQKSSSIWFTSFKQNSDYFKWLKCNNELLIEIIIELNSSDFENFKKLERVE